MTMNPAEAIQKLRRKIGDMSKLNTIHKDTLVDAINDAAASGAGIQSDWECQDDTSNAFIKNKPFDVVTSAKIVAQNIQCDRTFGIVYEYLEEHSDIPWVTPDDIGKRCKVTYNGNIYFGDIVEQPVEGAISYVAFINFDEYFIPEEYPAIAVGTSYINDSDLKQNEIFMYEITDEEDYKIISEIQLGITSRTKLSGDKIQLDETTITSDNGRLTVVGGGGVQSDWTEESSEAKSYIKHKPNIARMSVNNDTLRIVDTDVVAMQSYTGIVTTTWQGSNPPYSQQITIEGVNADDLAIVDIVTSVNYDTCISELNDYSKIFKISITGDDTVMVYALDTTTVPLTIQLRCFR